MATTHSLAWSGRATPCTTTRRHGPIPPRPAFIALATDGVCFPSARLAGVGEWEGMQNARGLLDLDQGSMTIYKNDEKMGVMVPEGLTGPYSWAMTAGLEGNEVDAQDVGTSVRIESGQAPASPTEEELAAEKAWQDESDGVNAPPSDSDDD